MTYYKIKCPICKDEIIAKDTLEDFTHHCMYRHKIIEVIRALAKEADLYEKKEKCSPPF